MRRVALVIAILSFLSALIINELNLSYLEGHQGALRYGETVITADDYSYLNPAENFLETGELKNSLPGNGAYFMRPPGYSIFFVALGSIMDFPVAIAVQKYIQLILFGLSIYCLVFVAYAFLKSKILSYLIASFYGISGIGSGFLYYTLTEGVTPALVIFFIYFLIKAKETDHKKRKVLLYYSATFVFAFLFITRPVLGVLGLSIPFFLFREIWKEKTMKVVHFFSLGLVAFSFMIIWQIRNVSIAGEYVGMHPVYYAENSMTSFRPTHEALWDLYKGWGCEGAEFHGVVDPFWSKTILGEDNTQEKEKLLASVPDYVTEAIGQEKFEFMVERYEHSILYQSYFYDNRLPMPKTIDTAEREAIQTIELLTQEFKSKFWFDYYISSPIKVFGNLAFHSNLSLFIYQYSWRGKFFMEALRVLCFGIHSMAFLLLIISAFIKKPQYLKAIFSYSLILYVGYLVFVQRGLEERYTLPILPLVLVSAGYWVNTIGNKFLTVKKKRD